MYAGDLLFNGRYPVCFDEKAHGQICRQEGIASIREVFDDLVGQAEKMYKAGVPAEEAQHRYVVPDKLQEPDLGLGLRHRARNHHVVCRMENR